MWGAGLRFLLAAVLLFALISLLKLALPRGRALTGALLYSVFQFSGAFGPHTHRTSRSMIMNNKLRTIGISVLGLLIMFAAFAVMGLCQLGYGQARPYLPGPALSLIWSEEDRVARDYLDRIPRALEIFRDESEGCAAQRTQPCLTRAVDDLERDIGEATPAPASWMSGAHGRLYLAVSTLAVLQRRSEVQQPSSSRLDFATLRARDEFLSAAAEWDAAARR